MCGDEWETRGLISHLTKGERTAGLAILLATFLVGLAMAIAGRADAFGVHGWIVLLGSAALALPLMARYDAPDPHPARISRYYDDPIKMGVALTMIWAIFGMLVGVWVAAELAWPQLSFDTEWLSFGRLRPAHTTGVIFGFGGNALISTSFHVVQRTSRARLAGQVSPWFVLFGFNLFCVLAVTGYWMGVTQSKEYAEAEWYADLWLVIVWVTYFILFLRTLARRQEPHIYVANWYYLAFIVVVAISHIIQNLALPIGWGTLQSYTIWAGVQDSMGQCCYRHHAGWPSS